MSALHRREVVGALLANRGDLLVVAGLGSTAWDCAAAGDHPLTFPMWGGMGCAAVTGLGLALAQPARRVLVVTGDGEMLMGLGSLATIGVQRPANLSVVVIDNERYGETGMQKTHTAYGVDLAAMARAAGFASAVLVREASAIEGLRQAVQHGTGPHFAQVKVAAEKEAITLPPREGTLLKNRFREALLGASASLQ
jgi:thiamine pyrophosphate-dependent acetolactate synthase large subunit-like protein